MADSDFIAPQIANGGGGSVSAGGVRAPDYRQLQNPAEIDVRGIDRAASAAGDEASRRAAALSDVFKEANTAVQDFASSAGTKAGAAAGMAGNPKPMTGLAAITAYGSSYDAAAHLTYMNNARQSAEQSIDRIEQDTPANPGGFQTRAQGVADAAIKNADPVYQPELQQIYGLRIQAGVTRLRGQAIETAKSDALDSYTSTVDDRIGSAIQTASALPEDQRTAVMSHLTADNQAQLAALVKAGAITQGRADILAQKFSDSAAAAVQQNYTTNIVTGMMNLARSGDVDAADKALHQYMTDPNNDPAGVAAVTKEYLAQADAFHQAQSRLHANDIAAVGQQLVQGTGQTPGQGAYGPQIESQIHGLYKNGSLSPEGLHSLMDQSMRNQVSAIKDDTDNQLVDAAIHGGTKLDPENKDQAAAADKYFRAHIAISGIPPLSDAWTAGVTAFARQTNVVPAAALSQIRIGLLNPATAAQAAAAGERIRAANPQLDPYDKDPRSAALATEINSNLKTGMAPPQAVQLATATINRDEGERKIIDKSYARIIQQNPDSNRKALQSALDAATPGLFAHAPAVPVAMQAENDRLVSTYYGLTQNIDTARALAAKQIQTTWGVSRMNGQPELTKYPPERLGVSPAMIRADVASSAASAGYTGDASQIHLTPNAYTDASSGRVWTLTHTDAQTGMTDVLLDKNNQPLMYHVPQGQDFARARQQIINQKLDAARAERDQQRKNAAEQIQGEQQLADYYLNLKQ